MPWRATQPLLLLRAVCVSGMGLSCCAGELSRACWQEMLRWILTVNTVCNRPLLVLSSSRVHGWDSLVESHCVTQVQQASRFVPCLTEQCIGVMLVKSC
eukprot:m.217130 g.217130  ORF g.217130 m.217130 type:complete len:99 (+) comp15553_c0_seq13:413-709(+)